MYAIVDIETTGGYASANGITEIAVFVHDGKRVIRHFETLINPRQSIPRHITALTGIDDEMVKDAPVFEEIAETLGNLLNENIFVAHSVNFDYSFVKHQLKQAGIELTARKLCTVRLAKRVFPGFPSYSLGNLCRSLDIDIRHRHRAGGDAKATVKLFEHMLANGAGEHIAAMLKKSSGEQWLPLHLPKSAVSSLPVSPGVYYFHDQRDKIIYVGKAVNIRKRVSGHFTQNDPDRKRQNFILHIHRISYRQCATELEALVLESTEIRRLWPKYNYSQKRPQQRYGLYLFEDARGYMRLAIDKRKKNLPALYRFHLLHEGMNLLKKMAERFELDEKLCFINKQPHSAVELAAMETPSEYNERVKKALEELDAQLPTFAIVDEGQRAKEKLCLLIEKGSFWGMGYLPETLKVDSATVLKNYLQPYADSDYIRNSIYSFAAAYPAKMIRLAE